MTRKNWPEITSAFAVGLGAGAILALVLAPQSGEATRAYLRGKARESMDEAAAQGKNVARQAQKVAEGASEFVNDALETGKAAYREASRS